MSRFESLLNETPNAPAVRGFLHRLDGPAGGGLVLTHGAGSNSNAPLLVAVADVFAGSGFLVLRCDLPFRQARPHGPPLGSGAQDRAGLRRAAGLLRELTPGRLLIGGHSYGGRQASMLAAEDPAVADGLLLLSYPLHPPKRPEQLRTAHFAKLQTPAVFVHGSRDPFGSLEEMREAASVIPAPVEIVEIEGAAHDLGRRDYDQVGRRALAALTRLAAL